MGTGRRDCTRLTLTNLESGRQLILDTKNEDSEVLAIDGGLLLYRINHSIFKATISDKKLGPATPAVQEDDVP